MKAASVAALEERIAELENQLSLMAEGDAPATKASKEAPKVTIVTSANVAAVGEALGYDFSDWSLVDLLDSLLGESIEGWDGLPEGYAFGDKANNYLRSEGASWEAWDAEPKAPKSGKALSLDKAPVLPIGFTNNGNGALAQRSRKLLKQHGVEIPKRISKASIHRAVNKAGFRARFVAAADL